MSNPMGEYPGDPRIARRTVADPYRVKGPVRSPIIKADTAKTPDDFYTLLKRMPDAIFRAFERLGIFEPHLIQSFAAPSGADITLVAAAAPVQVASFSLPEQCDGFLTHVILGSNPGGGMPNILWTLKINGAPHPQFTQLQFPTSSNGILMPFKVFLSKAQTISIWANSALAENVNATLLGWGRFIPDVQV